MSQRWLATRLIGSFRRCRFQEVVSVPARSYRVSTFLGDSSTDQDAVPPPRRRPDPMARRPNQKCDPYGQGGKPLSKQDATRLKLTVHSDWTLEYDSDDDDSSFPVRLRREFIHPNFLSGAAFVKEMAAVAELNSHYPSLALERRILSKEKVWQVVSTITCHTKVLGGLSHHDFFVATLMDVESERPEIKALLLEVV